MPCLVAITQMLAYTDGRYLNAAKTIAGQFIVGFISTEEVASGTKCYPQYLLDPVTHSRNLSGLVKTTCPYSTISRPWCGAAFRGGAPLAVASSHSPLILSPPISFAPGPLRPFFHRFRNAVARRQPSFTEYSSVSDAGAYTIAYSIPIFDANGTVAQVAASSILASSVEGAVSLRDDRDPALSRACLSHC